MWGTTMLIVARKAFDTGAIIRGPFLCPEVPQEPVDLPIPHPWVLDLR
jgi:hypothetical protein